MHSIMLKINIFFSIHVKKRVEHKQIVGVWVAFSLTLFFNVAYFFSRHILFLALYSEIVSDLQRSCQNNPKNS